MVLWGGPDLLVSSFNILFISHKPLHLHRLDNTEHGQGPFLLTFITCLIFQARYCRTSASWAAWMHSVKNLRGRKKKCIYEFWIREFQFNSVSLVYFNVRRVSSVGIATRFEMDGSGIESRWGGGGKYSSPVQNGPEAHPSSCTMGTVSLSREWRGLGVASYTPLYSAEVKERVELCIYSPFGPLWLFLG